MNPCSVDGCGNEAHARGWCRKHYMRWWEHGDPSRAKFIPAAAGEPAAFIEAIPSAGDGCLRWPYATNGQGYGQINLGAGKKALVSRIVCERRHGPPPSGTHQAAHTCGKGHEACVAPWHLEWKTPAENISDQIIHGTRQTSESKATKLTAADAAAIRSLDGTMPHARIGEMFGVSQTLVSRIIRGEAWREA